MGSFSPIGWTDDERRKLLAYFPLRDPSHEDEVFARVALAVDRYRATRAAGPTTWLVDESSRASIKTLQRIEADAKRLHDTLDSLSWAPSNYLFGVYLRRRQDLPEPAMLSGEKDVYTAAERDLAAVRERVADLANVAHAAASWVAERTPRNVTRPRDRAARSLANVVGAVWNDFAAEPMRRTPRGSGEPSKWERFIEAVYSVAGADTNGRRYARGIFDSYKRRTT